MQPETTNYCTHVMARSGEPPLSRKWAATDAAVNTIEAAAARHAQADLGPHISPVHDHRPSLSHMFVMGQFHLRF